ncbi:hypothetical protein QQY24_06225 [Streptomyces sp. TG1A-8]|uniref:hypothetical protein n=1 Tax=Streptomyces sp. TG1A-8 TaxID=3051385 RepID=UPI00265C5AE7|nr:hypothetical protein [Streptomyces sp. TG1A-8]MDO0925032.1 hypothetical protein [Streptomyces sp. TG1A-8]
MSAVQEYLRQAADAGLVGEATGLCFVADRYDDPFTGRKQVLVEYCDPRLPASADALEALVRALHGRGPAADAVLLRVVGDRRLPPPWRPRLTYVRHRRRSRPAPAAGGGPAVRPATSADDARVHDWLVQAFRNAYPGQDVDPHHAGVADIMASPGRRSFIAEVDGVPVGHGTVLVDERDAVTGEEFAELVDTLVDDPRHRRAATAALVAAIAEATGGRALCGHVVHPYEPQGARHAEGVLRALTSGDWSVDHCFWERPW